MIERPRLDMNEVGFSTQLSFQPHSNTIIQQSCTSKVFASKINLLLKLMTHIHKINYTIIDLSQRSYICMVLWNAYNLHVGCILIPSNFISITSPARPLHFTLKMQERSGDQLEYNIMMMIKSNQDVCTKGMYANYDIMIPYCPGQAPMYCISWGHCSIFYTNVWDFDPG